MRICLLAEISSAHTVRWANALNAQGVKVIVLSPGETAPGGRLADGVEVEFLQIPPLHFYCRPPFSKILPYFWQIRHKLAGLKADVIHIHYIPSAFTNLMYWVGLKNLVISVWGSDIVAENEDLGTRRATYKRAILTKAKVITATTRFLAQQTARYLPEGWPIEVIPFGIDLEQFRPMSLRSQDTEKLRIGFCKPLEDKYAPLVHVRAFAKVAASFPQAEMVFCGGGSRLIEAQDLVKKLGLEERVKFLGKIPYQNMPAMMNSFDILVMASASESFGVAAVEAQACGVPVITSDLPGIREAVDPGETALLVPPEDAESLSTALSELIANPDKRASMGAAGLRYARTHFDITRGARRFMDIYEQVK